MNMKSFPRSNTHPSIWQILGATALSVGWLIPHHYLPWTSFHNEAWIGGGLLGLCLASFTKQHKAQPWPYSALFAAALCVVLLVQLAVGQLKLAGMALMSGLYLLGFMLAILTGARWQGNDSDALADSLFVAFCIAACLSAGIQLCQWLELVDGCLCSRTWALLPANSQRPAANLAQPNHLATLLLMGVIAFAWGWLRKILSGYSCAFAIAFLLLGLALTGSRTGALSLLVLLFCTVYWRRLWPSRAVPFAAAALFLLFVVMVLSQNMIAHLLLLDHASTVMERAQNEARWDLWRRFGFAAIQQPWFGFGWNQTATAQVLSITTQLTEQGNPHLLSSYAHNLFLDFVVWMGVPFGLLASAAVAWWLARSAKGVKSGQDALLMFTVIAFFIHAMLEMPLYYAYFLLPLGLIVGILDARMRPRVAFITRLTPIVCIWFFCGAAFAAVVRDYFVIEQSFSLLRLDAARIIHKNAYHPPQVLVLTQLRDFIGVARLEAAPGMSQDEIDWVADVTLVYPSQQNLLKLAQVMALNEQELKAAYWLTKLCNLYGAAECGRAQREWARLQIQLPQMGKVPWPESLAD